MLTILAESALRSLVLGSVVWVGLNLLRARNPHVHMTSWVMVLVASLSMPFLMHWTTVTVTLDPLPLSAAEKLWPASAPLPEPLPSSSALELGPPHRSSRRNLPGRQLVGRRDGHLHIGRRDVSAEIGGRPLSDVASGPRGKTDK